MLIKFNKDNRAQEIEGVESFVLFSDRGDPIVVAISEGDSVYEISDVRSSNYEKVLKKAGINLTADIKKINLKLSEEEGADE
jgi:hypothetical protein